MAEIIYKMHGNSACVKKNSYAEFVIPSYINEK